MSIKLRVSDRVSIKMEGDLSDETGEAVPFDFILIALRVRVSDLLTRPPEGFMQSVTVDWQGVLGEDGEPVPYSAEALTELFDRLPGLEPAAVSRYGAALRLKEKQKN